MSTTTNKHHQPWVEKYRPKNLQSVSHQKEVVATLQNAVSSGNLPHLLFYGPPGSGKTSVALALCRQLWHPSQYHRRVLELNASDERGISIVRDKIKHFASLSVATGNSLNSNNNNNSSNSEGSTKVSNKKSKTTFFTEKTSSSNTDHHGDETTAMMDTENDPTPNHSSTKKYPNPPFKIIILDEADTVTPDAQAALRRIIEANSRVTRFILICNYVTRIIEPLASRCAKFRFQSLPIGSMKERLQEICTYEDCPPTVISHLDDIIQYSDGDMRRAVTTLQSVHSIVTGVTTKTAGHNKKSSTTAVSSSSTVADIMSPAMIAEIVGVPPDHVVNELWEACIQSSYDVMNAGVDNVIASGFSAQLLLSALLTRILLAPDQGSDSDNKYNLDETSLALIAIRIAEAEKNMIDGADEYLQLMTVCSLIFTCYSRQPQ